MDTPNVNETLMNSETVPAVVEHQETTTFVDNEAVGRTDYSLTPRTDVIPSQLMSIKDFLARPYMVANFTWNTGGTVGNTLFSQDVTTALTTYGPFVAKLYGFLLFRGRATFRVVINANPFQMGRLLIHFLPHTTVMGSQWVADKNVNLTTKTQHPHVELDCRQTSAELSIPYTSPTHWLNLKDQDFDFGTFYVDTLSLLTTGNSGYTSVSVSCYLYFEDVELNAPLVPQSRMSRAKKATFARNEEEALLNKPVSAGLSLVSKGTSLLSNVPFMGPVLSSVSWATDIAAGIVSALGWSKPRTDIAAMPIASQYLKHSANFTGERNAFSLALDSRNRLELSDANSLTNEDEMSFNYLKSIEAFVFRYTWTTALTQPPGFEIKNLAICPLTFFNVTDVIHATHHTNLAYGPPFFYLSNYFQYWRGSIILKFKIIKTQFHTGRLQITFTPRYGGAGVNPDLVTGYYSLREIVDLRTCDEITLRIPYMNEFNYLPIGTASGSLRIVVLNELVMPETVPSSVEILMFASAGEDFELQAPTQVGQHSSFNCFPMSTQGRGSATEEVIGGQKGMSFSMHAATQSIGEMFTSVKQILNRSTLITYYQIAAGSGLQIWPWWCPLWYMDGTTGVITANKLDGDAYKIIAPMYVYYRGGVEITVLTDTSQATTQACVLGQTTNGYLNAGNAVYTTWQSTYNSSSLSTNQWPGFQGVTASDSHLGMASFAVPYYAQTKCSLVRPSTNDTIPSDRSQPCTVLGLQTLGLGTAPTLARSFADDFQLSYFIGCPGLVFGYV